MVFHSDSQFVVDGLLFLQAFGYVPTHWSQQLLWSRILQVVQQLETDQWLAHKVHSHFDSSDADSSLQEWYISGNDKVDKAAARIHLARSDSFLHVVRGHFSGSRNLVDTQLAFLLDIARFDLSILSKDHAGFDPEDVKLSSLWLTWHMNAGHLMSQFEVDFAKLWGGFSLHFS